MQDKHTIVVETRNMEPQLYLWKVTRQDYVGYDEYDSMIVAAHDESAARQIHPEQWEHEHDSEHWTSMGGWAAPETVLVEQIGVALGNIQAGDVVLASFRAG